MSGKSKSSPLPNYFAVFFALLVGTALTVYASGLDLGRFNAAVALTIASIKATLVALFFMHIKGVEYKDKFEEHHVPGASFNFEKVPIPGHPGQYADPRHAQLFFSLYFVMTGLHALHMIIGLGIFLWLLIMAWKGRFTPEWHTPVEIGGLYWHFVDIIWIYLFPLLYLIDRHP